MPRRHDNDDEGDGDKGDKEGDNADDDDEGDSEGDNDEGDGHNDDGDTTTTPALRRHDNNNGDGTPMANAMATRWQRQGRGRQVG